MIIGITGGLGTGKSTVSRMLKNKGAYVIDADKIVHRILGKPERKRLSAFIFQDRLVLKRLCRRIHPLVKKEISILLKKNKAKKIIIIDAPLLIESGLDKKCHIVVVVKTSLATQVRRASQNLGISKADCLRRQRLQMPLRDKIARADFVIDNNGLIENTKRQVNLLWKKLSQRQD